MNKDILFLVGPTASGKTEVSLSLAKKLNAEIISCDSMQIYKGMDILSSKPTKMFRKRIRHYLLDVVTPDKEYNVSRFRKEALKAIEDVIKHGKRPLFVGGTGLYATVLLDGIFDLRTENKSIRNKLSLLAKRYGSVYLHNRLKRVDPAAALKIHPNDARRLIRALEVYEVTGKPISELQKQRKGLRNDFNVRIFCLKPDKDILVKRIERRVERMFKDGLVKEVKKLRRQKLSRTARYAIGIQELSSYLNGECDLKAAKQLIKRNTFLYAKRQLTWFRKDKTIEWISVSGKDTSQAIALRIANKLKAA
jgi:tRNA dimethylallyltransferase